MFRLMTTLIVCSAAAIAHAQPTAPPAAPAPAPTTAAPAPAPTTTPAAPAVNKLPIEDLEAMLGPVALYPDNLLASVLTGAVYPLEIVKVQRYMEGGGKVEQLAKDGIEPPVQSLAKVPEVLKMMSENIDWTQALGQAYLAQSEDVMKAVQNLRAKAKKNNVLKTSQEQTVVEQGDTIIIESSSPEVVYVPSYNPQVVYVDHDNDEWVAGAIGFGVGIAVGAIWHNNCDWHGGCVGWGGGYHGDVDVDINNDINIDNSRVNNINKNDLKNTNAGRNRAGQEGQKWKPNPAKASQNNLSKPGGTAQMDKFRGAGKNPGQLPSGVKMPNPKRDTPAAGTRPSTPSRSPSAGNTAVRPSTPSRTSAPAKPMPSSPARPTGPSSPAPSRPTPKAPAAANRAGSGSSGGGFSKSTPAQTNRGSASRGSAGSSRGGSGGGSRGGGGGGRR